MNHDLSSAARVWRLNFLLSTATLSAMAPDLEALGLAGKEFFVLDGIEDRPFPAALARYLSLSRPNLTQHLKALQARGLISRSVDARDLRRHRLVLTDAGRACLGQAREALSRRYEEKLQRLSAAERAAFAGLLEKLVGGEEGA
ncbi:MarR family winged helix-turn-helix transcriptional regulator [Oceanicella sp. SM1341]|uniref:MarR family winged helix-turn-helix transcriptional regulator n=1 Tax=Oceanicella sp. SM1341 TaxID=1548889 RepID=UPI0013001C23|nr:MarR family transcriptional regulator [Oceanicella sp. SM1341]